MPSLKTEYDETRALALLRAQFGDVTTVEPLRGGEVSRAYGFEADGRRLVLRVNALLDYAADVWASAITRGSAVPVPAVLATGRDGELHWAISERVPGRTLQDDAAAVPALVPALVATLRAIHALPPAGDWFGFAASAGARRFPTWRAFVEGYALRNDLIDWPRVLGEASADERAAIERAWAEATAILPELPELRAIAHGDFSFDNILASDGRISGVIDWASATYGDPLRDVAWIEFWSPHLGFADAYLAAGPPEPAAVARLACYRALNVANAIGFYLHTGQREAARWVMGSVGSRQSAVGRRDSPGRGAQ